MSAPILFLDVNIPMYAAGVDHPYRAVCAWVMGEVSEGRLAVAINTEIVQEILHRLGATRRWERGARMARNVMDLASAVHPVLQNDVRKAIELFERYGPQGVRARDVVHAAVMLNNSLTHILSTDEHFDVIEGITRVKIGTLEETRSDLQRLADAAY